MKTFLDKQEILNRFKKAFNIKSDSALSEYLGISKATISNWKNRDSVDFDLLFSKCEHINMDWLLTGEGEMLRSEPAKAKPAPEGKGVPLIPIEAIAGFGMEAYCDIPAEAYYNVEDFRNADFLIRIKGDSMLPKYNSGDIIACTIVTDWLFFQWNHIYAINTKSQGIMIKRIRSSQNESLTLVSDNPNYAPFDVPILDINSIALVIGAITLE